ncbi:hypothetical protein FRZ03_05435 [Streptomyces misionensis]|uniref:Uncharacterized protein n=1 Tax=Streptomyces misionensis TaxID=67331 RepID=A0A5C6K110_9ACTN|nr:hypothetical protein [Streptomyces misionensis]TWV56004.1 hypothetical protein FRZ03_05435 [Streptomyces misionensis]
MGGSLELDTGALAHAQHCQGGTTLVDETFTGATAPEFTGVAPPARRPPPCRGPATIRWAAARRALARCRPTTPGSTTLRDVHVADDRVATVTCDATTLAPGQGTTCHGSCLITQGDLDVCTGDGSGYGKSGYGKPDDKGCDRRTRHGGH